MNETYDVSAFRAVFERSFTWISGFLRNVRRFGEKTAVIDPASGWTWTYAALNRDANRLANALQAADVAPGDVVLLSNASTSFDMFRNFEERGNLFKELVNRL